jgi:hypothetical protein
MKYVPAVFLLALLFVDVGDETGDGMVSQEEEE